MRCFGPQPAAQHRSRSWTTSTKSGRQIFKNRSANLDRCTVRCREPLLFSQKTGECHVRFCAALLTSPVKCMQVWIIKAQERKEGDKRLGAQAQSQAFYDEDDCDDQGRPKMKIGTSLQIKADDLEAAYKMVALGGCSSMGEAQAAMNAKKVKDMQAKQHAKSKAHHHPKRALSPEGAPTGQSSRPRHGPSQSPSRAAAGARQPPPRRAPGWETKWGDTHKKWFYFNQITKQHSWEFPVALPAVRHVFVDWSNVVSRASPAQIESLR